jgi:CheY-like chemotaxis protein/anti-sigma regulatory factor (Ser/Thr protein kinase)
MTKVLVVDDNAFDRNLAGKLLEKGTGLTVVYAADGKEGLAVIAREEPDLVLTDLQMPEMTGLELVEEIKSKHPSLPVILMTAHGSEEIAMQALRKGAASYVPKRNLAQDLVETVEGLLGTVTANQEQKRLLECLTHTESHFLFHNDPTLIAPLLGHLQDNLTRMQLCDEIGRIRVTVAIREALVNAIHHGNLEVSSTLKDQSEDAYDKLVEERRRQKPYRDRRVYVSTKESPVEATYIIRDEGPGFDYTNLPDPTDPSNVEKVSGRGLFLIRTFMDEVRHNDTGNEITMTKRRD